ncbi:Clavaminate synthase-like protein [Ophiobolus disseminans]|uniref:Clavaminate synthase-like protein n=1 Tax=Ophiobolus disseminans TaxID=1469910 RepID=A0A6A7AMB3_9PLEO|nr:Clavaminate synthase-like protein [Ophiobolus disseminans]
MDSSRALLELPLLDARLFTEGNTKEQLQFAQSFHDCLKEHGFAKVVNHGLDDAWVAKLHYWNQRFFNLPDAVKDDIAHVPGPDPQRGFSRLGAERTAKLHAAGTGVTRGEDDRVDRLDAREHFDQGSPQDYEYPNRWPAEAELAGFREFMEAHYVKSQQVSCMLLNALELSLGLPASALSSRCLGGASELRLNHYPTISAAELKSGSLARIWPHTDLGVLTCLFQDDVGGLEIEDRRCKGTFRPIPRQAWNEMVVNVSETLERWTNGQLAAGVHRVSAPAATTCDAVLAARYSNAFFVKADRQTDVGVLQTFVRNGEACRYSPMTALEYHKARVASAY